VKGRVSVLPRVKGQFWPETGPDALHIHMRIVMGHDIEKTAPILLQLVATGVGTGFAKTVSYSFGDVSRGCIRETPMPAKSM
jgi:hypothetical protein